MYNSHSKWILILTSFLFLLFSFSQCDNNTAPENEESLDAHVCEHLENGPSNAITAIDTADIGTAPVIGVADHHRYDVTLLSDASDYSGWAKFSVDEEGHHFIYLSEAVTITVYEPDGSTEVTAEYEHDHSQDCALIHGKYEFHLEIGTYFIFFEPAAENQVNVVIAKDHHDHDHHEH